MILAMGLADRLVGVSTYDLDRPETKGIPAVGDYLTVDWEQLAGIRPKAMIVEIDPARLPAGFAQRAADLGIEIQNFDLKRLGDVYLRLADLGQLLREPERARRAIEQLRGQLAAIAAAVAAGERDAGGGPGAGATSSGSAAAPAGGPSAGDVSGGRVSALMVMGDGESGGTGVVGPGTFLDDLLQIAGGSNAAAGLGAPYPIVDDETLSALRPGVIFLLLPEAAPQVAERAKGDLAKFAEMPAVRDGKIFVISERYALLPGAHAADLAREMAGLLYPNIKLADLGQLATPGPAAEAGPATATATGAMPGVGTRPALAPATGAMPATPPRAIGSQEAAP